MRCVRITGISSAIKRNLQYIFSIRKSIQGACIGDVFCKPYTYQKSMYKGCDTFDDCLKLARDWSAVSKYQLLGKPYYHKIFNNGKNKLIQI